MLILFGYNLSFFSTIYAVAILGRFKLESLDLQLIIPSFKRYSPISFI